MKRVDEMLGLYDIVQSIPLIMLKRLSLYDKLKLI